MSLRAFWPLNKNLGFKVPYPGGGGEGGAQQCSIISADMRKVCLFELYLCTVCAETVIHQLSVMSQRVNDWSLPFRLPLANVVKVFKVSNLRGDVSRRLQTEG